MKIIKINNCGECQFFAFHYGENCVIDTCIKVSPHKKIDDKSLIPEWCPLEDEQDLMPALDTLQGYLEKGCYIDYGYGESYGDKKVWLYRSDGDLIASGKNIEELRINLVKKEA